jgi:hypothetical protein
VSQFILAPDARVHFFRAIAQRLRPGGYLASADLASDTASATYQKLLEVWLRLMRETGSPPEQLESLRVTYGRDVALLRWSRSVPSSPQAALRRPCCFSRPVSSMLGIPNELQPSPNHARTARHLFDSDLASAQYSTTGLASPLSREIVGEA